MKHKKDFITKQDLKEQLNSTKLELELLYKAISNFNDIKVMNKVYNSEKSFNKIKGVVLSRPETEEEYTFSIILKE